MRITTNFHIKRIPFNRTFTTALLVAMCIQFVPIEGTGVSFVKVSLMALAPFVIVLKAPYVTKALVTGIIFWLTCYFTSVFQDDMRFSTVGYLALFIFAFIAFYNLIHTGVFSLEYFIKLLRTLLIAYGVFLLLQQLAILVGIHNFPLINIVGQNYLELTKLPSLSIEPSHTARVISASMIGYIRCLEIKNNGTRISFKVLFTKKHRTVTILFLWTILTMGSGTGMLGLGILSLYFIRLRTMFYVLPLLAGLYFLGQNLELKQLDRVERSITAAFTGDVMKIKSADGSASVRIIPILNTLTDTDLTKKESWFGTGTLAQEEAELQWKNMQAKISIVEQYGILGLIASLILIYTCAIRCFFSIETLLFLILLGFTLGNLAIAWSMFMIFTAVRYFQERKSNIITDYNEEIRL